MTEDEARQQIQVALDKVRTNHNTVIEKDDASVNYHIEHILENSRGTWDEAVADRYLHHLQREVDEELLESSVAVLDKHKTDVTY